MEINKSNQSINLNKDTKAINKLVDNAKPLQIPATSTDSKYYNSNKVIIVAEDYNDIITIIDNSGEYRITHNISITSAKVLTDYINYRYNNNNPEPEIKNDDYNDGYAVTKHELIEKLKKVTDELEFFKKNEVTISYKLDVAIAQRTEAYELIAELEEKLNRYKSLVVNLTKIIEYTRDNLTSIIEKMNIITKDND